MAFGSLASISGGKYHNFPMESGNIELVESGFGRIRKNEFFYPYLIRQRQPATALADVMPEPVIQETRP